MPLIQQNISNKTPCFGLVELIKNRSSTELKNGKWRERAYDQAAVSLWRELSIFVGVNWDFVGVIEPEEPAISQRFHCGVN